MTHATTTGTDTGATDQAKEKVSEAAGQAQEMVSEAAGQAKEQIGQAAGQAKGRVRDQVDQRSTQAGQQVNTHAESLRTVASSLREQGQEQPAKIAEQAAQKAQSLGSYLERSDTDRILGDIESYARRQPWMVGLGAAALGFAAARFLKASSEQRYGTMSSQPPRTPAASYTTPRTDYGTFGNGTAEPTLPAGELGTGVRPETTPPIPPAPDYPRGV